ncbi:hypothetical protein BD779DRAFT_1675598 [Infundibulicybe gibba]|nr:hypothetical protein BD779DRAFT_1675598 [Infundibulicybe gibba]
MAALKFFDVPCAMWAEHASTAGIAYVVLQERRPDAQCISDWNRMEYLSSSVCEHSVRSAGDDTEFLNTLAQLAPALGIGSWDWPKIRATPSIPGHTGRNDAPAHFDTVLVKTESECSNKATEGTSLASLRVAQVRLIFILPEHLQAPRLPTHLAYIEWFTPFRERQRDSKLHMVKRSTQNRGPAAEIIPIEHIISSCHLSPKFGTTHRATWTPDEALEQCISSSLDKYISIGTFYEQNPRV